MQGLYNSLNLLQICDVYMLLYVDMEPFIQINLMHIVVYQAK